jgi:hypothetical protein
MLRKMLHLLVVEYPDGRVAVQALDCPKDEAKKLFSECKLPGKGNRMSLVSLDLQEADITVSGETKLA